MLVLMRRSGESIVINNEITVTVNYKSKNQIRVAVEAPKNISVHRKEINDKINLEKLSEKSK